MSGKDEERWKIRIAHIREQIQNIKKFVADMPFEEFCRDQKTVYAVIRCFQIMGEATKKIPESIRTRHDAVEWKHIAGFRDILVHDYDDVDLEMTWAVIKDDLPKLEIQINKISIS